MAEEESVLVIPLTHFEQVGQFQGFKPAQGNYQQKLLDPSTFRYLPRMEAELDINFKQLIPYIVLCHREEFFYYRRGMGGTENRLNSRYSIGIGGHINSLDAQSNADANPYQTGMLRELAEEVWIDATYTERIIGFVNDDRTVVGQVHLGVIHLLDLGSKQVRAREASIAEPGFAKASSLLTKRDQFETWSQFILEFFAN